MDHHVCFLRCLREYVRVNFARWRRFCGSSCLASTAWSRTPPKWLIHGEGSPSSRFVGARRGTFLVVPAWTHVDPDWRTPVCSRAHVDARTSVCLRAPEWTHVDAMPPACPCPDAMPPAYSHDDGMFPACVPVWRFLQECQCIVVWSLASQCFVAWNLAFHGG